MSKKRKQLSDVEASLLGMTPNKVRKGRNNARYSLTDEQWQQILEFRHSKNREFVETSRRLDKNGNITTKVERLQSKPIDAPVGHEIIRTSTNLTSGQQWIITAPKKDEAFEETINFDKIIKKYIKPIKIKTTDKKSSFFLFDRLVYSDVHIGMTTNKNGHSLYGGKWDEKEIIKRLDVLIEHTLENKKSNKLIIDELGDFMDGWDGETTRKGHVLPQNMDNEKAFDIGLHFKIKLIDCLAPHYDEIICNNICNDNHAGSFGYVVNKASKKFLEYRYSNVKIINHRKFINHYVIANNCFIITHGKDDKHLKFGFKPILDTKQIEKINNYIDHHDLHKYNIEFSKGDSHQKIFDESTSDKFNYYNYGAFSPSSEWVQTNFKKGKSFFEFFNFKECGNKIHNPFIFSWKVNRKEKNFIF